jgi:hypothetical protein
MLLGQTVAISVAWNLFETAVVMRKWLLVASEELSKAPLRQDVGGAVIVGPKAPNANDGVPSSSLNSEEDDASTSSLSRLLDMATWSSA